MIASSRLQSEGFKQSLKTSTGAGSETRPETQSETQQGVRQQGVRSGAQVASKDSPSVDVSPESAAGDAVLVLSAEERAALQARMSQGLIRAVMAQCVMAVLATIVAWWVAGTAAGLSALAGAGAYLVPNTLFALRLLLDLHRQGPARPSTFFLGEACKLVMTALLLWLVVRFGGDRLVWPAMLIGLVCVLKGYVLLLVSGKLS